MAYSSVPFSGIFLFFASAVLSQHDVLKFVKTSVLTPEVCIHSQMLSSISDGCCMDVAFPGLHKCICKAFSNTLCLVSFQLIYLFISVHDWKSSAQKRLGFLLSKLSSAELLFWFLPRGNEVLLLHGSRPLFPPQRALDLIGYSQSLGKKALCSLRPWATFLGRTGNQTTVPCYYVSTGNHVLVIASS